MFDELFTEPVVTIDIQRCLNTRHHGAGCSRCVVTCPTSAVSLSVDGVRVEPEACVGCGACAAVCPTDAVDDPAARERRFLECCEQLAGATLTISCAQNPAPRPAQPATAVVRHARCLASLDVEQFIAATGGGTRRVHVDLSWCRHCPLGRAADTIVSTVDAAASLIALRSGDRRPVITPDNLPAGVIPADDPAAEAVIDSWRPALSRRGLFSFLRAPAAPVAVPAPIRRTRGLTAQRLPYHVPASRRRLLERLDAIDAGPSAAGTMLAVPAELVPFADVQVDEARCSGCGLCARYCPTGALAFTTGSASADTMGSFVVSVHAATCLSCDICAHACPEDALSFGPTIDPTHLDGSRRVLASGDLVACATCRLPTAAGPADTPARCFSCRHGTGVVTALRDDAGLMADFCSRSPGAVAQQ
ncbi:MAG TPA: 4Fe-4S binding protein [Ilumatobacter sp.]